MVYGRAWETVRNYVHGNVAEGSCPTLVVLLPGMERREKHSSRRAALGEEGE